jgi:hypothetical protein
LTFDHGDIVVIELVLSTQRFGALQKITGQHDLASLDSSTAARELQSAQIKLNVRQK